jgi:hypothetical protein
VDNKLNQLIQLLNEKLRLFLSISIGVFLFILFFQPFPLIRFDFNNRLIFTGGFGAIVFLFMFIVLIALPWLFLKKSPKNDIIHYPSSINGFFIFLLSSVAFAFYLRYVGGVGITFFIMSKIIFICLVPPVILRLYDVIADLKYQNEKLISEKKTFLHQIDECQENNLNASIEFVSETNTDNLSLQVAEIAFIKSADNYVEIAYYEQDKLIKKLIRNTLKNIELQLKQYASFIRCHRTCIVNTHFIEKLNKSFNSYWIKISGYDEQIPVSRQYLLKLKESL